MSDKENYPEWGVFGTPPNGPKSKPFDQAQYAEGEDGGIGVSSESDMEAIFHLTLGVMPDGAQTVKIEPDDSEADKKRAWDWAKLEGWKAKLNSPDGERFKLTGKRDSLTAVIELARCSAARPDDLHSVWAALEWLSSNQEPPLRGFSDDGIDIKYNDGGKTIVFTKHQLRRRLERQ